MKKCNENRAPVIEHYS